MLDKLDTEKPNPASREIDRQPTDEILRIINEEDRKVADCVAREIPRIAQAVDRISECLAQGGRLFYVGAGTSGRLGVLDAAECPPTFSVAPEMVQGVIAGGDAALVRSTEASEDDFEAGARELRARGVSRQDAVVGIAASGRTPYVLGAMRFAREMGAVTVGLTANAGSALAVEAEIAIIPATGAEVVTGSTRMKAGTAAKLVLNMISTATMIRLGHVFGNLMVNVQPTNEKLRARARRIVETAGGVEATRSAELLEEAGGNVKAAIVMARLGCSRGVAEERLRDAGGRLHEAVSASSKE